MSIHAIFRCGCEYYLHLFFNFCSFTFHDQTSKVLQYFASSDGSKTCEYYMEIEKSLNSLAYTNGKTDSGEGDGDVNMDCDSDSEMKEFDKEDCIKFIIDKLEKILSNRSVVCTLIHIVKSLYLCIFLGRLKTFQNQYK